MICHEDFRSICDQDTLTRRIAALHVVYMFSKSQIMWFGQLVSQKPGIMLALKDKKSPDISEMVDTFHWLEQNDFVLHLRYFIFLLWTRLWMI